MAPSASKSLGSLKHNSLGFSALVMITVASIVAFIGPIHLL